MKLEAPPPADVVLGGGVPRRCGDSAGDVGPLGHVTAARPCRGRRRIRLRLSRTGRGVAGRGGRAGIALTVITYWSGCATTTANRPSAYRGTCLDRPCPGRAGRTPGVGIRRPGMGSLRGIRGVHRGHRPGQCRPHLRDRGGRQNTAAVRWGLVTSGWRRRCQVSEHRAGHPDCSHAGQGVARSAGRRAGPVPSPGVTGCRGSVPDAIVDGQGAAVFVRGGEPSAAQRGPVGRDEAAPDAVLADCPVPQRQLQTRAAHGAGRADSDGPGRLAAGCLRFGADGEPFVGINSAISASRLSGDLGG
jgi:hypothetical protein